MCRDRVVQPAAASDVILQMYWCAEQIGIRRLDPPGQRGGVATETCGETTGPEPGADHVPHSPIVV